MDMLNNDYTSNDFKKVVIQEIPLIDVRAPIEFNKGAFLNAFNLPLMNDEERHLVGICYKEKGNEEAVKLGYQLVSGEIKQQRIDAWTAHLAKYPNSMLYCFRGGLRSKISQEWIFETTGKRITRLEGGYKAFRNYLSSELEPSEQKTTPILLGGYTGSGKTLLLKKLDNYIDLEGIAHHRGSSFGRHLTPQPTQITFENNLAYALIQHKHKNFRYLILEDESTNIGRTFIPKPLSNYFRGGKFVLINTPFEERQDITMDEYVIESQVIFKSFFGEEQGFQEWANYIRGSIGRIKKRLGGDLHQRLMDTFELACQEQLILDKVDIHKNWIGILLKEYYDPMYQYQLQKHNREILFQGNPEEVLAYFRHSCSEKF